MPPSPSLPPELHNCRPVSSNRDLLKHVRLFAFPTAGPVYLLESRMVPCIWSNLNCFLNALNSIYPASLILTLHVAPSLFSWVLKNALTGQMITDLHTLMKIDNSSHINCLLAISIIFSKTLK